MSSLANLFTRTKQAAGGGGGGATLDAADRDFVSAVTSGDESDTGKAISATPAGDIILIVNGNEELIGDAVKTKEAYFSVDGGTTPRAISAIAAGDDLFWNGAIAGYELAASDRIRLVYET